MKVSSIFNSFSAGQISKRIRLRNDITAFQNGLSECINFIPSSHGPIYRRVGMRHVDTVDGEYGRIIPFKVSIDVNFILAITDDSKLRVFDEDGLAIDEGTNLVQNNSFLDGEANWTPETGGGQSLVDFEEGRVKLKSGTGEDQFASIRQEITTANTTEQHSITVNSIQTGSPRSYRIMVGTTENGSEILEYDTVGVTSVTLPFVPNAATFWIEIRKLGGGGEEQFSSINVFDLSIANTEVEFDTVWTREQIEDIQFDQPPSEDKMYFVSGATPLYDLSYNAVTKTWSFVETVLTGAPSEWTGDNWPSSITFFQSRLWLGGAPNEQETFIGSKTNDFVNFTIGTNANDAVQATLDVRGKIEWMQGSRNLLIGTENGENIIVSEGPVVKSGDIRVENQSSYGSKNLQAESVGNQVMYTSPDGRKVREMGYQWTDEGWVSRDITFTSEDITMNNRVREIRWAQNPENLLVCVTEEGNFLTCTYERSYDVVGWAPHTTDGSVLSVATVDWNGRSQVWFLVQRENENGAFLSIETFDQTDYMDSYIEQSSDDPTQDFSVPHLAGRTVQVTTDGAVHPDVTLDSAGNGTVQRPASVIKAGLQYISRAKTLPFNFGSTNGSGLPWNKRWNKVYVSLLESELPKINGVRPPDRTPSTPMDTREPAITDFIQVTQLGHDLNAFIEIEQELPVGCTINAIFGEVGQDQL